MSGIEKQAPGGKEVVEYDRKNLALYAALLEADDAGRDWREAAFSLRRRRRSANAGWQN